MNFKFSNQKFLYDNSVETIIKIIIEKLISYTITISEQKKIEKEIKNVCNNYIFKQLNPLVHIFSFEYDKDEFFINNENKDLIIKKFYEVEEPKPINKDRNIINSLKNNSEIKEIQNENSLITKISSQNVTFYNNKKKNKKCSLSQTINENKKVKKTIPHFTSFDLPKKDFLKSKPELDDIEKLRNERKLIEELKNEENIRKKKLKSLSFINKKEAKTIYFNSEKYTFDSNGIIIKKKKINDNLFQDNFIKLNSEMILIKRISNSNKFFNTKKNATMEVISNKKKENIFSDFNDNSYLFPELKDSMTLEQKKQNYCPPAGNNFNLIIPESGVIIKDNNNNIKKGTINENDNKLSLYQYNKIAKKILNKNKSEKLIFISNLNSSYEKNNIVNDNIEKDNNKIIKEKYNIIKDNNSNVSSNHPLNENYINEESNVSFSNNFINSKVDNLLMAIDSSILPLPKIKQPENNLYLTGFKNVFKNQFSILKNNNRKIYKIKKSYNFSFEENIKKTISTKLSNEYDRYNNKEEKNENKIYKKPFKPNFNELIKHNGILIPSNKSYRVKKLKKSLSSII